MSETKQGGVPVKVPNNFNVYIPLDINTNAPGDNFPKRFNFKPTQKKVLKKKPKNKVTQKGIKEELESMMKEGGWDRSNKYTGMWTKKSTVSASHSFENQRIRQVLRHISTAVFYYVREKIDKGEQEVEALYVNDRLLLSSNTMRNMGSLGKSPIDSQTIFDMLLTTTFINSDDVRALKDIKKLRKLVGGQRVNTLKMSNEERQALQQIATMIREAIRDPANCFIYCSSIKNAAGSITASGCAHKIIIVEGDREGHAEQNLILAYAQSGTKKLGHVYGKKRPCTGCYMTFRYAVDVMGLNLSYNQRPGGYWDTTVPILFDLIDEHNQKLKNVHDFVSNYLPTTTYRTALPGTTLDTVKDSSDFKNEVTDHDSESGSDEDDIDFNLSHIMQNK